MLYDSTLIFTKPVSIQIRRFSMTGENFRLYVLKVYGLLYYFWCNKVYICNGQNVNMNCNIQNYLFGKCGSFIYYI